MSAWHQPPSQYSEPPEHRPPPPDVPPQQSYPPPVHHPPPPHSQPPYPPPPTRENSGPYPPDSAYSRQGSVSAPTRSPAEPHHRYPPPGSGPPPHESPYYQQPAIPDYHRPPAPYGPPDGQPNGTHPSPLHVQTGHEMMPGQSGGPPPPPPHHGYGHPPPHSAGPPPTPGGYYSYYDASQQRRKPVRAAQACDSCRQRKAKCDEGRPECQHCKDNNLKCTYREMPPQKSEKQVLQITEKLETLSDNVNSLLASQMSQQQQIQKLIEMQTQPKDADSSKTSSQRAAPIRPELPQYKSEDSQARTQQISPDVAAVLAEDDESGEKDEMDYAMPPKHTTAVHNMFNWPSIRALVPRNQSNTYVMDAELSRGLLRLYGCGEGEDKGDGHEGAPSPAGSQSSEGRPVDDETSSSTPHGVWGNGQLPSPPTSIETVARDHPGGLSPRGGLMLDAEAVDTYFRSYMDNIHILHPFLEPKVLRKMIHTFKKKYSWDYRPHHMANQVVGGKRKREATDSPTALEDIPSTFVGGRPHSRAVHSSTIEHSVANAIVLLVIALGKVCAHRDPLPGPASTASIRTSTPHTMFSTLSDLPNTKSAPASPYHQLNGHHPTVAASSPSNPQGKNMDVIPGLSYFAKAADIIGELPGGVDVSHIQANLLAGLYMGQLARIIPSHSYISVACRSCLILLESGSYRRRDMSNSRRNLINFAFWSCLQLESDILAEVELPPSGISRYELRQSNEIPGDITLEPIPEWSGKEDVLRFYSYQIQLRRTMNDIHSILYKKDRTGKYKRSVNGLIGILEDNLQNWRAMLMNWDWDDDDFESPYINVARMRAKYYGARYIIHRPLLQWCLGLPAPPQTPSIKHSDSPQPSGASAFPSPVAPGYSPSARARRHSEMGPPSRGDFPVNADVLRSCRICVESAIRSTTAFDKVPRRLIITNIFGTAHAQFGNCLVLAATFTSPHLELSSMVPEATLRRLFDRTLAILLANEIISPVLAKDARILQHVRSNVFPDYPKPSMSSSFSSR